MHKFYQRSFTVTYNYKEVSGDLKLSLTYIRGIKTKLEALIICNMITKLSLRRKICL